MRAAIVALLVLATATGNAQSVRSTYFMEGAQYRLQLNPALAPERGYINLPVIGHAEASVRSNTMGFVKTWRP